MISGMSQVADNIRAVRASLRAAADRSGRDPSGITLMAVTKGQDLRALQEALGEGISDIGENRVQEAASKSLLLPRDGRVRWHMIGHLQTNKVRTALSIFDHVHSVDSLRLARAVNEEAGRAGRTVPVYAEVNVSGENSKYGILPGSLPSFLEELRGMTNLRMEGLMTMAPFSRDPEGSRPYFRMLAKLARERGVSGLSMGMSGDFTVAIEEGATIIRVGRAIFG